MKLKKLLCRHKWEWNDFIMYYVCKKCGRMKRKKGFDYNFGIY